ncbi:MAG: dihydrodipicolinate synthase family protein [Clostridia bacterium]|nr:dihydrodipicolinate synthase family protein [Clostridia bacterium]
MSNKLFSGIMPALITPINEDGSLKETSADKIIKLQLDTGVQGFYVNGATGEGLFLSEDVRRRMVEIAVEACAGKAHVINHVGAVDTQQAVRLAAHAGEIGCDAISSLVPNYVAKYTTEQILDYYRRLHDASGLPVLVYCTNLVGSEPYAFMREAIKLPGLIGCKYTMFDYYSMHRITELNGGDINVINGPDEMLICGLTMGADGGIGSTYNLMPERFLRLYNAFRAGRFEEARSTQFEINKVISVLLAHNCIAAIKLAFTLMGIDAGDVAYPGKRFDKAETNEFIKEMREAGFEL